MIVGNIFFSNRVLTRCNKLEQQIFEAPSLNIFKNGLQKIKKGCVSKMVCKNLRKKRMGFFMD